MPAAAVAVSDDNINVDQDSNSSDQKYHEMSGSSHNPWRSHEFPMVPMKSSNDHAVLYLRKTGNVNDKWDHDYVRMPFSSRNMYDKQTLLNSKVESRWEVIKKTLKKKPILDSGDLERAILKYNPKFQGKWKFDGLHRYFQSCSSEEAGHFFHTLLPFMIELALKLPDLVKDPIPMLKKGSNKSISLSQIQIASLLANAFFCTFPRRNEQGYNAEYKSYPKINFSSLFETASDGTIEKMKCIFNYFDRIGRYEPDGVVTFSRRHVDSWECPKWVESNLKISSVKLTVDDQRKIEDMDGYIQVDFANKFIGGGVLGSGCVQEEIRFVISPELMAAMLFTEELEDGDAVLILGSERYSKYRGYGRQGFKFDGNFVDKTPRDGCNRRRSAVLAIDAVEFNNERNQFRRRNLLREVNKAWIGFSFHTDPTSDEMNLLGIATGNWGCGAFGGSPALKSLLQLAAAAAARRPLVYLTFGDTQFKNELVSTYQFLCEHDVTVGQLCKLILSYFNEMHNGRDLHTFLQHSLTAQNSSPSSDESSDAEFVDTSCDPTLTDYTNNYPFNAVKGFHQQYFSSNYNQNHPTVHMNPNIPNRNETETKMSNSPQNQSHQQYSSYNYKYPTMHMNSNIPNRNETQTKMSNSPQNQPHQQCSSSNYNHPTVHMNSNIPNRYETETKMSNSPQNEPLRPSPSGSTGTKTYQENLKSMRHDYVASSSSSRHVGGTSSHDASRSDRDRNNPTKNNSRGSERNVSRGGYNSQSSQTMQPDTDTNTPGLISGFGHGVNTNHSRTYNGRGHGSAVSRTVASFEIKIGEQSGREVQATSRHATQNTTDLMPCEIAIEAKETETINLINQSEDLIKFHDVSDSALFEKAIQIIENDKNDHENPSGDLIDFQTTEKDLISNMDTACNNLASPTKYADTDLCRSGIAPMETGINYNKNPSDDTMTFKLKNEQDLNSASSSTFNPTSPTTTENKNVLEVLTENRLSIWYHGFICGFYNTPCTIASNSLPANLKRDWFVGFIQGFIVALNLSNNLYPSL